MNATAGGYNERVRAHFAAPDHAGDLRSRYPRVARGTAADAASGCRLALVAGVDARLLREVRFRVFGCPHLIAAAEEWCRRVQGGTTGPASMPSVAEIMSLLAVPVEKTGRMLLLEDAWTALLRDLEREPSSTTNDQR